MREVMIMLSPRGKQQRDSSDEPKQVIHFRLPESLYNRLVAESDKRRKTMASIMQEALEAYLDNGTSKKQ
jgi:hypothetical protein